MRLLAICSLLATLGCESKSHPDLKSEIAFSDSVLGHKDTLAANRRVSGARYVYLLRRQLKMPDSLAIVTDILCEGDYLSAKLGADQGARAVADAVRNAYRTREDSIALRRVESAMATHAFEASDATCDSVNARRVPIDTIVAYHQ
jgi:hypothetical protein